MMKNEFYCGHCGKFKHVDLKRTSPGSSRPCCGSGVGHAESSPVIHVKTCAVFAVGCKLDGKLERNV